MQRRSFLAAAVAALVAPVAPVVHARLPDGFVRLSEEALPRLWGDGVHDDTAALQARVDQCMRTGQPLWLPLGTYRISGSICG